MNNVRFPVVSGAIGVLAALSATTALGDSSRPAVDAHPHYAEALTDLRLARALLEVPDQSPGRKFDRTAVDDIDQAMAEIKHAEIDDGKGLNDHPPLDANVSHRDRMHEVESLLQTASRDLNADEDDKKALGWRARAIKDTADARAFVVAAIENDDRDEKK